MPRNVRNFWIETQVDGRKTDIGTGPRSKDGGIYVSVGMRDKGDVESRKVELEGFATTEGKILLIIKVNGIEISRVETER